MDKQIVALRCKIVPVKIVLAGTCMLGKIGKEAVTEAQQGDRRKSSVKAAVEGRGRLQRGATTAIEDGNKDRTKDSNRGH